MVDGVLLAVGAAVAGVVHQLAPIRRIRIGDDVVVLEIVGGGSDRQVVVDVQLLAEDAAHVGQELLLVPVADLAADVERDVGLLELVEAGVEPARGVDRHFRDGELAQLVADGAEVGLDLARLALAGGRELVVDQFLERVAGPNVAQHARDQDGDSPQQDQDGEQLCRQSPARGTIGARGRVVMTYLSLMSLRAQRGSHARLI